MDLRRLLLLAAVAGAGAGVGWAQDAMVPRFEPGPCAIAVPAAEKNIDCGYLVVRENRSASSKRTIRLPIAILRSLSAKPKPDPVLRTLGGPGASSLRLIRGRRSAPWLADRDYIIFEQRGTRYAQPSLECPEVDEARREAARARLAAGAAKQREIAGAKLCYERLVASGVDLSAYNSRESAADIEDLRRVLHIDKVNLYGVSYSARLMLDVVRYHPAGVRSVVLESTLPPEANYDEVGVDTVVRALNEMFAGCRADAQCDKAYPGLEREFYAVVARLNAKPLVVATPDGAGKATDIELNGNDFATWIVDYLFSNEPAATVDGPAITRRAFGGDYVEQFRRYAGDKLGGGFYSWGMRYSVWCSEELPFESRAKIRAQSTKHRGLRGYEVMALPDICRVWHVKPAAPTENLPVSRDIPTLAIGAQYDAYTAPAWGLAAARRMRPGFFFEVPWAGHGPAFAVPCVGQMVASFIDTPTRAPDGTCLETTRKQFRFTVR